MTRPMVPGQEPGETEFSHGRGLRPSRNQRAQRSPALDEAYPKADPDGPWQADPYEAMKAVQRTDPADPGATAAYDAPADSIHNSTQTQWTRER